MSRIIKIRQLDKQDCGAACLASISSYYGLNVPITEIRQKCNTSPEGTNIRGILTAASYLQLEAHAYKSSSPCYTSKYLSEIPLPSILHLRNSEGWLHFVVLYKVTDKYIQIMDPSDGEVHKLEEREFLEAWTGYLITVRPGAGFLKGDTTTPFIRRIAGLVSLYRKEIIPSMAGSIIYVLTGLSISIFLQNIIDNIIPNSDTCSFGWYSSGIGILIALSVFIGYVRSLLTVRGSIKIDGTLILGYMHHILRLPLSFFHERSTGDINSRVNDIYRIRAFVSGKLVMISISAIALILSFFLLFTFYWKLAAMTMGFIPIYAAIYFFADKANKKNNKRIIEASAIFENSTIGSITAIETAKYFSSEELFYKKVEGKYTDMALKLFHGGKSNAKIHLMIDTVTQLLSFVTVALGTMLVLHGELTTGELVSFYTISSFFTSPLTILIESTYELNDARIAAQRVFEVMDLKQEWDQPADAAAPFPTSGEISFSNISFRYPGKRDLFHNLSFTIQEGAITSIIGDNGCGKSTIASLLMRGYLPSEGAIEINGTNINDIDIQEWRKHISIIPQKDSLFDGTVLENIVLGDWGKDIDNVMETCEYVGMVDFFKQHPQGLETRVGEQGKFLSGGERSKISLARAIIRKPDILIMDEVTSHMDSDSAARVYEISRELSSRGVTIINITHDRRFLEYSDYIVDLNKCVHKGEERTPASCTQT